MVENLSDIGEQDFTRLAPRELSKNLMRLPAKNRLAVVLSRTDAEAVVAAFPVQDFFFFVKEIGPDDAVPLLALGQVEQLVHLFDLEWWDKDRIQPAKALQWLEKLASAGEEKLLAWLYHADFELLVAFFKKSIRVVPAPEDLDPLEAREQLPKHTLDDQFFWETQYLQFEDFLRQLLSLIFEEHPGFYRELMNRIVWVSEAEVEEDAYRFNQARLEDQGIPEFYDALEIYRAIRPGQIGRDKDGAALMPSDATAPSFALALLPEEDLLTRALKKIQDVREIDTLRLELASLANKVILADRLAPDEPLILRRAVDKVAAYVNLGLDTMSGNNLPRAVKIIEEVFLEHLFRLAHTQIARLKGRLRSLIDHGWLSGWPTGLRCLETDWMESAQLLLQKTPRITRPAPGTGSAPGEDFFRDRLDLSRAGRFIEVISALGRLFEDLSAKSVRLSERLWQRGQIRQIQDITLGVMIWTAAAQSQLSGSWEVEPLRPSRWSEQFGSLGPEVMEDSIRSRVKRITPDEHQQDLLEAYLNPLFQEYAQEMLPFSPGNPPDPRLVKYFIFEEQ